MLTNVLRMRAEIWEKLSEMTPTGEDATWQFLKYVYCRRVPLDTNTIFQFQQLNTVVTDKLILNGDVEVNLGKHRFITVDGTYEPKSSAYFLENATTVIVNRV